MIYKFFNNNGLYIGKYSESLNEMINYHLDEALYWLQKDASNCFKPKKPPKSSKETKESNRWERKEWAEGLRQEGWKKYKLNVTYVENDVASEAIKKVYNKILDDTTLDNTTLDNANLQTSKNSNLKKAKDSYSYDKFIEWYEENFKPSKKANVDKSATYEGLLIFSQFFTHKKIWNLKIDHLPHYISDTAEGEEKEVLTEVMLQKRDNILSEQNIWFKYQGKNYLLAKVKETDPILDIPISKENFNKYIKDIKYGLSRTQIEVFNKKLKDFTQNPCWDRKSLEKVIYNNLCKNCKNLFKNEDFKGALEYNTKKFNKKGFIIKKQVKYKIIINDNKFFLRGEVSFINNQKKEIIKSDEQKIQSGFITYREFKKFLKRIREEIAKIRNLSGKDKNFLILLTKLLKKDLVQEVFGDKGEPVNGKSFKNITNKYKQYFIETVSFWLEKQARNRGDYDNWIKEKKAEWSERYINVQYPVPEYHIMRGERSRLEWIKDKRDYTAEGLPNDKIEDIDYLVYPWGFYGPSRKWHFMTPTHLTLRHRFLNSLSELNWPFLKRNGNMIFDENIEIFMSRTNLRSQNYYNMMHEIPNDKKIDKIYTY